MDKMKAIVMCVAIVCIATIEVCAIVQGLNGTLLAAAVGAIASIATGTIVKLVSENEVVEDSGSSSSISDSR